MQSNPLNEQATLKRNKVDHAINLYLFMSEMLSGMIYASLTGQRSGGNVVDNTLYFLSHFVRPKIKIVFPTCLETIHVVVVVVLFFVRPR